MSEDFPLGSQSGRFKRLIPDAQDNVGFGQPRQADFPRQLPSESALLPLRIPVPAYS